MNANRAFVDSNIWLYALINGQDLVKHHIAQDLVGKTSCVASIQVVQEICSNLIKKFSYLKAQIKSLIKSFSAGCEIIIPSINLLLQAEELRGQYHLSYWDSLIVASAIAANVEILYSEDMQSGILVYNRMRIVNPFS